MNQKPLYFALVLTALLLTMHLYALSTYFYWHHRWFDIPMHILGGVAIGSFLLAFFNTQRTFFYFACMLIVTVVWEIFEYYAGISRGQPDYWFDTIKDIVDGMIGASITFLIAKKSAWH
ncbi:MAG: hypothetical protein ABIT47_03590 [Candidatus Paceibacterota bacterium]